MDSFNPDWLVSEVNRKKALKRFEIRQFESQLNALVSKSRERISSEEAVVEICRALCQHYSDFLHLSGGSHTPVNAEEMDYPYLNWQACYGKIEALRVRFYKSCTESEQRVLTTALSCHYQLLSSMIKHGQLPSNQSVIESKAGAIFQSLSTEGYPAQWIQSLVQLANHQAGLNMNECTWHMETLDIQQLKTLSGMYVDPSFIDLFNAVFFYKLHPELLFQQSTHPEKLLSAKIRVSLLYDFIKVIYHAMSHVLIHKGLPVSQNYLLDGDMLPDGIEIKLDYDFRELILNAIKSLTLSISSSDSNVNTMYLQEIVRAYKFWFNPSRLLDAVMSLQQTLMKQNPHSEPATNLYRHMIGLYKSIPTCECLDLYGYFSNKDSCYFMRTLLFIKQHGKLGWLPDLSQSEREAIHKSYDALMYVMNALREALNERNIETQPYKHHLNASKAITPGRRIRYAVRRIIKLYQQERVEDNKRIDALFSQLERLD